MTDDRIPPDPGEDAEVLGLAAAADAPARAPAPELRDRIMRDLAERPFTFLTAGEGIWLPSPNASVATRLLFWDSADHAATRLVRLAAGHTLPPAMLGGVRTLYVTAGVIHTAGGTLEQGDFTEEARPVQDWRARRPSTVLETSISRAGTFGLRLVASSQAVWRSLSPGIRASTLVSAHDAGREVLLIRAEPESVLQGHDHEGVEELFVLQGSCVIEDHQLEAGDYHRAAGGSRHHPARTGAEGCLLYCSVRDSSRFTA